MAEIKKLTDTQREMLKLLGWSADSFQQTALAITNKTYKKSNSIGAPPAKNKEYYDRTGRVRTIQQVVEKLTPPAIIWIPLGYCYFVRLARCKNCGSSSACLDSHSLFLVQTDKRGGTTRKFSPVETIAYPNLPHWTKDISVETLFCLECYNLETPLPIAEQPVAVEPAPCNSTT